MKLFELEPDVLVAADTADEAIELLLAADVIEPDDVDDQLPLQLINETTFERGILNDRAAERAYRQLRKAILG